MDQNSSSSSSFDLHSQPGVMSLLASIRASQLSASAKNELRDLVFLYTNGGGDNSVRIAIEQKISAHQIIPILAGTKQANKGNSKPGPVLAFGSSRPAPVFKQKTVSASVREAAPIAPVAPVAPIAPAAPVAPAPQAVPPPTQVSPTEVKVTVQSIQAAPEAPVASVTPSVPVAPQPVPEAAIAAPVLATPTPTPAAVAPVENIEYLNRIREIKSAVNSKVGNPVNLVDINNEVGREYMNALLDAMKRLSGGVGGIVPAMDRLETAYKAVEVAVADHDRNGAVKPEPVAAAAAQTQSVPEVPKPPVVSAPIASPVDVVSDFVVKPIAPEAVPVPNPPLPKIQEAPEEVSGFDTMPTPAAEAEHVQAVVPEIHSVVNDAKVMTPADLPASNSVSKSDPTNPLMTRDIDDGLEQLLSDWSLFKKSGLFGTGPHGREHPLFKKIASLPIPLLLAGRFEGSTQEIKQSITDYMNGWRYEQGIIYEQGEQFEHYLRRVIRQILDLQKKRP